MITQCQTPAQFLRNSQLSLFNLVIFFFNLETNGPDVVAECCTHLPQLLVSERKKKYAVGTEVGKEVQKNPKETWPCLYKFLFNYCLDKQETWQKMGRGASSGKQVRHWHAVGGG